MQAMENNNDQTPDTMIEPDFLKVPVKKEKKYLPFTNWWPFLIGALVGVILRIGFSQSPSSSSSSTSYTAMSWAFIILVPMVVGAVTVYFAETKSRRSVGYYIWAPAFANMLFVVGTMLILIEGIICAIIIIPLFCMLGIVGGLVMGAICRMTNWPRQAAYGFMVLPLIFGALPPQDPDMQSTDYIERTIMIAAPPEKIWSQLQSVSDIKPSEVGHTWIYRIGVPLPLAGVTQATPEGLVRKITMGKSVYFDQVSTDWEENRHVKWRYRFYKDSFPPNALDDHVMIGGHYFDLMDTEYTLVPKGSQLTELKIRMHYRVSTEFNWYAKPVGRFLIGNFEEVILDFYRQRSINSLGAGS
jgi:hypothetical protein